MKHTLKTIKEKAEDTVMVIEAQAPFNARQAAIDIVESPATMYFLMGTALEAMVVWIYMALRWQMYPQVDFFVAVILFFVLGAYNYNRRKEAYLRDHPDEN